MLQSQPRTAWICDDSVIALGVIKSLFLQYAIIHMRPNFTRFIMYSYMQ